MNLNDARILSFQNEIQYQSFIEVQAADGSFYLITISNSKKFQVEKVDNNIKESKVYLEK